MSSSFFTPTVPFDATDLVQFDTKSGEILQVLQLPSYAATNILAKPGYLAGKAGLDTHYVDVATMQLRPKVKAAPVVKGLTITGLPAPTRAMLFVVAGDGTRMWQAVHVVNDGVIEFSSGQGGTYVVALTCAPWLKSEIELHAE